MKNRIGLTLEEQNHIKKILTPYMKNPHVQKMKKNKQHGVISTYQHCHDVSRVSYWLNRRLHLHADERALLVGAFLHDFYLYDWHVPESYHRLHGFFHAEVARKNAVKYFQVGIKEQEIIRSHMWPLNITKIPKNREALIVCVADKYCSTIETLLKRK